ncbi:MAG: ATP-binding cassette domain-containing protein [Vigna little leaf phytoplasma]|nr:ATP-binding cassette domain-containing protein [Vigna little leaf phytoplasma]
MAIQFNNVNFRYHKNDKYVLKNINLEISSHNEFIALIGRIGAGKSTFIQLLNGLLTPTSGFIKILEQSIYPNTSSKKLLLLKQKIGLVFQFPEYQLFETNVLKDVMFGPKNLNYSKFEAEQKAIKALRQVNIKSVFFHCSPFHLSGGQQRKVAIAGILAMNPQILVLDEPTRGLDIQNKLDIMAILKKQNEIENKTIILVTHDMDLVAQYAHKVLWLDEGKVLFFGLKNDFFNQPNIKLLNLVEPQTFKIMKLLEQKLGIPFKPYYSSFDLFQYLKRFLK